MSALGTYVCSCYNGSVLLHVELMYLFLAAFERNDEVCGTAGCQPLPGFDVGQLSVQRRHVLNVAARLHDSLCHLHRQRTYYVLDPVCNDVTRRSPQTREHWLQKDPATENDTIPYDTIYYLH